MKDIEKISKTIVGRVYPKYSTIVGYRVTNKNRYAPVDIELHIGHDSNRDPGLGVRNNGPTQWQSCLARQSSTETLEKIAWDLSTFSHESSLECYGSDFPKHGWVTCPPYIPEAKVVIFTRESKLLPLVGKWIFICWRNLKILCFNAMDNNLYLHWIGVCFAYLLVNSYGTCFYV